MNTFKTVFTNRWFKWSMIGLFLLMIFIVIVISVFKAGKVSGDQNSSSNVFTIDDNVYKQSDLTNYLMQSDEKGSAAYSHFVLSKVMNYQLKKDNIKISDKQLNNYAKQDVKLFLQNNPTANAEDFQMYVNEKYGSDADYKQHTIDNVTNALYAKKYVNINNKINSIMNDLTVNAKTRYVKQGFISKDDKKAINELIDNNKVHKSVKMEKRNLSPYTFYRQFGKEDYQKYMNTQVGNVFYVKSNDGYYVFDIKQNKNDYHESDLKKDIKNDLSFYLEKDIQKQARQKSFDYLQNHKKLIDFKKRFDYNMFMQGLDVK